jgi:hypothetical protein
VPKLKLGPLPDDKPVRVAVTLSAELHRLLLAYAEALAAEGGGTAAPAVEKLIPPMLERFVRSDRAFLRLRNAERRPMPPTARSGQVS